MLEILGVVYEFVPTPPVNAVPPVDALYQSIVEPAAGVAERVTVPVPHLEALIGAVGALGAAPLTVTTTFELAVAPEPSVIITLYVPATAGVTVGFCVVEKTVFEGFFHEKV